MRPSDDSHVVCCFVVVVFFAKEDCRCKQHSQSKKKKSFSSKFTNVYVVVELHCELIIIEIDMCSHIFFRKFNFLQTKINLFNFMPSLKLALLSSFKKNPHNSSLNLELIIPLSDIKFLWNKYFIDEMFIYIYCISLLVMTWFWYQRFL